MTEADARRSIGRFGTRECLEGGVPSTLRRGTVLGKTELSRDCRDAISPACSQSQRPDGRYRGISVNGVLPELPRHERAYSGGYVVLGGRIGQ